MHLRVSLTDRSPADSSFWAPVVILARGWEPPTGELADFLDDARDSLPANTDIVLLPLAADDQTALVDGALLAQWQRFVDRHRPVRLCRP